MVETLEAFVRAHAAAPWVLLVVALLAAGDALLPPLPSETVVVALAAISVAASGPNLVLLAAAAATGAFVGDTTVFLLGRRFGTARLARVRRRGLRRALDRAADILERRGGLVILAARYVPVGRVAVDLTAGAGGFGPRRFVGLAALAAVSWAAWTVSVGALAGHWLDDNPLLGAAAGITVALALGFAADHAVRVVLRRRGR
ncbi:DedA family protein [Oryzobacter sp. R7]|uniref:DedA family protein n=1 Tax=Oryzobacter faecalis TaxID=3388656 RepID=UPI00398CFAA7